jgi:hypothetical protein
MACFATLDTTTKYVSTSVPLFMALWFRYAFQAVATTVVILPLRGLAVLRTAHPKFQVLRGLLLLSASVFALRPVMNQVGDRCNMVTCAQRPASAGTSVAAVAPEPITTTRLPAASKSSGQSWGCTRRPPKVSMPGHCGV